MTIIGLDHTSYFPNYHLFVLKLATFLMIILQDSGRIWRAFPLFDIRLCWYQLSSAAASLNANVENIRQPAVSFMPESFNFYSLNFVHPPLPWLEQIRTTLFLWGGGECANSINIMLEGINRKDGCKILVLEKHTVTDAGKGHWLGVVRPISIC